MPGQPVSSIPAPVASALTRPQLARLRHLPKLELYLEDGRVGKSGPEDWSLVQLRTEGGSQPPVLPPALCVAWPAKRSACGLQHVAPIFPLKYGS